MAANLNAADMGQSIDHHLLTVRIHLNIHRPESAIDSRPAPAIKVEPAASPSSATKHKKKLSAKVKPEQEMTAEAIPAPAAAIKAEGPVKAEENLPEVPQINQVAAKPEGFGNNEYLYSISEWIASDAVAGPEQVVADDQRIAADPNPDGSPATESSSSRQTQGQLRLQSPNSVLAANNNKKSSRHHRRVFSGRRRPAVARALASADPSANAVIEEPNPAARSSRPSGKGKAKVQVDMRVKPEPLGEAQHESGAQRRARIKMFFKDFYPVPAVNSNGTEVVKRNGIRFYRKNFFEGSGMAQR